MTNRVTTAPATLPRPRFAVVFAVLNGLVLLGVLFQAVSAGAFMGHVGGPDWHDAHQGIAYLVDLLALAAAIVSAGILRAQSRIVGGSAALFVLLILQTVLGEAITSGHHRPLLAAHVPIALLIVALGCYLSLATTPLQHDPQVAVDRSTTS